MKCLKKKFSHFRYKGKNKRAKAPVLYCEEEFKSSSTAGMEYIFVFVVYVSCVVVI
jgi:hypothetical protein